MFERLMQVFKTAKPVIGLVHGKPLPGSPLYKQNDSEILDSLEYDLIALQEGGIDAVMFANENDRPYQNSVNPVTVASISYFVGKLKQEIEVPFGIDIAFDPIATLAVAKATGASFVREIFTGAYAGDLGIWNTNCSEYLRYRRSIDADYLICVYNIMAEFVSSLDNRPIDRIAKSIVFSSLPDAIAISGNITGESVDLDLLKKVKKTVTNVPVFVNTGVNIKNIEKMYAESDGIFIGTGLKIDNKTFQKVDKKKVKDIMDVVKTIRK